MAILSLNKNNHMKASKQIKKTTPSYLLPGPIIIALARYFLNRAKADFSRVAHAVNWNVKEIPWDKQADLDNIDEVSKGTYVCATAGTFQFHYKGQNILINQENWPYGKIIS